MLAFVRDWRVLLPSAKETTKHRRSVACRRLFLLCCLAGGAALVGCREGQVKVYRVPKEKEPVGVPALADAAEATPAQKPPMTWQLPVGWQEQAPGPMRAGLFTVAGTDNQTAQVSIVPLAGRGGGELENVNRWRGQVGLGRIGEAEMGKLAEPVEIAGRSGRMFDLSGVPPGQSQKTRILAAILFEADTAWFFKMTGPEGLVEQQKPGFVGFLKTVSFVPSGGGAAEAGGKPEPRK
jgi:hypothetical protein